MNAEITILGNNSAAPTRTRNQSAQVLSFENEKILIDCGEGTQKRLLLNRINFQKIKHVFISHLHGDHFLGLMGLLNTMALNGRRSSLQITAPKGLKELHAHFQQVSDAHQTFDIEFTELEPEKTALIETGHWTVRAVPLSHRISCFGYLFHQKQVEKPLDIEACQRLEVPTSFYKSIKQGQDYIATDGTRVSNAELTKDLPSPIRYGYMTDTLYRPDLAEIFRDCTAVYHEATYLHNLLDRAMKTAHSTALQAAEFASKASANQLLIGHFSSRYDQTDDHLAEAQSVFANTFIAEEGKTFKI